MYSVKGFIGIPSLLSNVPGVLSDVGELSANALSFSKEKGFYEHNGVLTENTINLVTFSSKNNDTPAQLTAALHANIFVVSDYVARAIMGFTLTSSTTSLVEGLYTAHSDKVENIDCGEMMQVSINGNVYWAPEWVSWYVANSGDYVRVWFMDSAFQTQYDEYEIVVVPPFTPLNNFFLTGSQVEALLNAVKTSIIVEKLQLAKNENPETVIGVEEFDYHNPARTQNYVQAKFGVLIYGAAGNNPDAIKTAIGDYILANSTHTREDWIEVLPDIFKRTEFVFMPNWGFYAIPNRELEAGIYSPFAGYSQILEYMRRLVPNYPSTHVIENIGSFGHTYRSLHVAVIGGPENRDGIANIDGFWSDYISVNTSSTDFNRMSPETQSFARHLDQLIQIAETMTKYSRVPAGYNRLIRDDFIFATKSIDNVQYLVVSKQTYTDYLQNYNPPI